jgi:predicted transcriptional regulator
MNSITIKLPAALDRRLRAKARRGGESLSALARRALEREAVPVPPWRDFATFAAKDKGMWKDGPPDLSEREGYGPAR